MLLRKQLETMDVAGCCATAPRALAIAPAAL